MGQESTEGKYHHKDAENTELRNGVGHPYLQKSNPLVLGFLRNSVSSVSLW